jgi:hypothetical protein
MSVQIETPTREKLSELPESTPKKIAAQQAWETLTAHQQQRARQILIQICQELLRKEREDEAV